LHALAHQLHDTSHRHDLCPACLSCFETPHATTLVPTWLFEQNASPNRLS
jgi:hypothetical protein